MKKKVVLLLTILALCITMTGCAFELPFKKDNVEDTTDVSATEDGAVVESTGIEVMNGATFTVGSEVSVYDLVMIPESMGSPVMAALIDTDGMTHETITVDTVGDFTYEIAIDFEDGNSFGDVVSFSVTDGTVTTDESSGENGSSTTETVNIPTELLDNINNNDWNSVYAPTTNIEDDEMALIDSSVVLSFDTSKVDFLKPAGILPGVGGIETAEVADYLIGVAYIDFGLESYLKELGLSPINSINPLVKNIMNGLYKDGSISVSEELDEAAIEELKFNLVTWYTQAIEAVSTRRTIDTGYNLYDTDGNAYPLTAVLTQTDFSKIGLEGYDVVESVLFYYTEYSNGYIVLFNNTLKDFFADGMSGNNEFEETSSDNESDGDVETPTTYEEFLESFTPEKDIIAKFLNYDFSKGGERTDEISKRIIIGDYSVLKTVEPVNEEGSVQIDGTPGDGEDEEKELNGSAGKVTEYYVDKYPKLYTGWPVKDKVYRRWIYNMPDGTTYVGSIIPRDADGIIQVGGATVDVPDDFDDAPEVGDDDDEYGNNTSAGDTFTLRSSYADYTVVNGKIPQASFNTAQSTSGRLALTYNGIKYYIETGRASQVSNYISECMYSTSQFQNGSFSVQEDSYSTSGTYGNITSYSITYVDLDGKENTVGYMAVYAINNDYLICYADALPTRDIEDTLVKLLNDMITMG